MSTWSPARMPKIRDGLYRLLADPDSTLRRKYGRDGKDGGLLEHMARNVGVADLYWATAQMSALAVGSAETIPSVRWTVDDRPSPTGLLIYDGGIGQTEFQGDSIPVDAVAWGPHPDGMLLSLYLNRRRVVDKLTLRGEQIAAMEDVPPLIPVGALTLDTSPEPKTDPRSHNTLLTTVYATWMLMQQPTITDRTPADVDRRIRAAYGRARRDIPQVTLVALRRLYRPAIHEPADPDQPGRHYNYRWIVRGHWRDQAYGPGRALRRPTWIPSHIKGPDGADLLETAKVNVWRR